MVRRLQSITASCPPQNLTARVASDRSLRHHALARRNAENLHKKLLEAAEANKNVVRRVPAATEVVKWVAAAKELPRVVSY
jgi:hypothetical protein